MGNSNLIGGFPEVFDSSMLGTLKSCQEQFRKIYIEQWKGPDSNVHLIAGGAFAKGIEVARKAFYEEDLSAEDAEARGLQALIHAYGDFQCPPDSAKSLERTAGALEFYFTNYPLNHQAAFPILLPGGKRAIEFGAVSPLPIDHPVTGQPILYSGRMDAVLNYAGGVFTFDEKTTSYLGPNWSKQWDLRSQFAGYAWLCRQYGFKTDGTVVRGVSILKTKYETQESIIYHPEWMVNRWYLEMLEWIKLAIQAWESKKWLHNLDHSCAEYGGCSFRSACATENELPWLETYFVRRHWDPVTRKETLLAPPAAPLDTLLTRESKSA